MTKKKVLYFMPDNPISGKAGNITRLNYMLSYFNSSKDIELDFVSLLDWGNWKDEDIKQFAVNYPNVNLHILNKKHKGHFFNYLFGYKIPYLFKSNPIDLTSSILRSSFNKLLKNKDYDTAIISYSSWGNLISKTNKKTQFILDTHDFITAQKCYKNNKVGDIFQGEIEILRKFDEIWSYSVEEEYIFGQFTDKTIKLLPITFCDNTEFGTIDYKYDITYVASNNPHNIAGINWFIKEVLPHLNNVKVNVIGKIGEQIEDHPNIIKHGVVDDIDQIYKQTKIAICPMLTGTGIKIKVVEALSYGIPVVTNRRGVDGLVNKSDNGCVVAHNGDDFAKAITDLLNKEDYYKIHRNNAVDYYKKNHKTESEFKELNDIFLKN